MSDGGAFAAEVAALFTNLFGRAADRSAAIDAAFQHLSNAGLINRVALARYRCARGCTLATVIGAGGLVLARTRDYKMSPGMNAARSVAAARRDQTLDGARHWPGYTFDVNELAGWGASAGIDMNCSHKLRTIIAADILHAVASVEPGHPRPPILV